MPVLHGAYGATPAYENVAPPDPHPDSSGGFLSIRIYPEDILRPEVVWQSNASD
jgi:hypothetical protein